MTIRYRMEMSKVKQRLSAQDWVEAGLKALTAGGPDAVAIEPLASSLGATKGSGYWHFSSRGELLYIVLEEWKRRYTLDVIERLENLGGPAPDRLRRLLTAVSESAITEPGQLQILVSSDPQVRKVVEVVTEQRIAYIGKLLHSVGQEESEARRRAILAYASYLGFIQLAVVSSELVPDEPEARAVMGSSLFDFMLVGAGSGE